MFKKAIFFTYFFIELGWLKNLGSSEPSLASQLQSPPHPPHPPATPQPSICRWCESVAWELAMSENFPRQEPPRHNDTSSTNGSCACQQCPIQSVLCSNNPPPPAPPPASPAATFVSVSTFVKRCLCLELICQVTSGAGIRACSECGFTPHRVENN